MLGCLNAAMLGGKEVGVERWENFDIWKLSGELAFGVYKITSQFPQSEQYGLTSQTYLLKFARRLELLENKEYEKLKDTMS